MNQKLLVILCGGILAAFIFLLTSCHSGEPLEPGLTGSTETIALPSLESAPEIDPLETTAAVSNSSETALCLEESEESQQKASEESTEQTYSISDFDDIIPGETAGYDLPDWLLSIPVPAYGQGTVYELPSDHGGYIIIVVTDVVEAIYESEKPFDWLDYNYMLMHPESRPEIGRWDGNIWTIDQSEQADSQP